MSFFFGAEPRRFGADFFLVGADFTLVGAMCSGASSIDLVIALGASEASSMDLVANDRSVRIDPRIGGLYRIACLLTWIDAETAEPVLMQAQWLLVPRQGFC